MTFKINMKLVFITNYIHHHQIPLADEFYRLLGDDYKYIATDALPDWLIKGGYDPSISRPYVIRAYENDLNRRDAKQLVNDADVVIVGSAPEEYVEKRIEAGELTFRYSERWFKKKPWFLSGPHAWFNLWHDHIRYRNKPVYMLAASAYTCRDVNAVGAYKNKVFKWGYFTKVEDFPLEASANFCASSEEAEVHIMWCARFLRLKHPELPIMLAKRLKANGYKFVLDMYGSGMELEPTKRLASELGVLDVVHFLGNLPNDEILKQMRRHEIFLFTSDKNEGWGAVLNESNPNYEVVYGNSPKYLIYNNFKAKDTLFPLNLYKKSDTLILVEGLLDALWLHKMQFTNTLSVISAQISRAQLEILKSLDVKTIILCLDNDKYGEAGCKKLYDNLKGNFVFKKVIFPEGKKDVQECTKEELDFMFKNLINYPVRNFKFYEGE